MTIQSPVLTTTTSLTAMGHGFIGTAGTPFEGGIPLGINTLTQEIEYFDPWAMKEAGILDTMPGIFLGKIKHGKSQTMKIIAIRLMMLAAGFQTMRTVINDYKPEGKASEYGAFSSVAQSRVHRIAEMQVNPLEERLFVGKNGETYELGVLSMSKAIIEFAKNEALVGHEDTCLRIAVYTMMKGNSGLWGLGTLAKLLRSISDEQMLAYYQDLDNKLKAQLEARLDTLPSFDQPEDASGEKRDITVLKDSLKGQIHQLVNAKDNTNLRNIQMAGDRVASYLDGVLEGSFGRMLGDKHSLYDVTTQRAVTKDWRGVSGPAETLMRIIDTTLKTSAIENHQLELLPHLEIDDERHKSMSNIVYARTSAFYGEIARGLHTCSLSASHQLDSLRKAAEGSELYKLGNIVISNLGWVGIGKQNNDAKALKELQDRYGFTTVQRDNLPTMPKRVFAMKYAEAEMIRYVQIVATEMELEMGKTEAAIERMMTRPDIYSQDDIARYADENNLKLAVA